MAVITVSAILMLHFIFFKGHQSISVCLCARVCGGGGGGGDQAHHSCVSLAIFMMVLESEVATQLCVYKELQQYGFVLVQ